MKRPFFALLLVGCTKSQLVDIAMSGADHASGRTAGEYLILAGDMHCHILPPDAPYHVSRQLPSTFEIAKKENLDFVVLTPHVPARFYEYSPRLEWVLRTQRELREQVRALHPDLIVIPGFEYTDYRYGHVGMSFADPAEIDMTRFHESWVEHGGLMTINHPVNLGLPSAPFQELRYDMSWRAFFGISVTPEIDFITTHAGAIESYNASVTQLRDQFMLDDEDRSLRTVASLIDHESRRQNRKIAAVGGSDSHGEWLRATTFVLARARTKEALREGLAEARTCVRGPEACTLQARADRDWVRVGDSLTTTKGSLEVQAQGDDITYVVNGSRHRAENGRIPIPTDHCTIVRAIVDRSWSSGIYVNCGF